MKCISFKQGTIGPIPIEGNVHGKGLAVNLGCNNRQRMELFRNSVLYGTKHVHNAVYRCKTIPGSKKRGQRVTYQLLKPIPANKDTDRDNKVILHFATDHSDAQMRLISGVVVPLVDSRGHHCDGEDVSGSWQLCTLGGAVVVLHHDTTVRLLDKCCQPYDITNRYGKVTCEIVTEEAEVA